MRCQSLFIVRDGKKRKQKKVGMNRCSFAADLISSRVAGHVDIASGYAFVCTPTICVVWNFAKVHSSDEEEQAVCIE